MEGPPTGLVEVDGGDVGCAVASEVGNAADNAIGDMDVTAVTLLPCIALFVAFFT
jgi:hypothetical protein